jgi:hypothetical protein
MCLLYDNDEPCNHTECRLIMKVRALNRPVFEEQAQQNIMNMPSGR